MLAQEFKIYRAYLIVTPLPYQGKLFIMQTEG